MKIQCNVCEAAEATVLCCADEAALCSACDQKVHTANKLVSNHQRVPLSSSHTQMPKCDVCQETVGYFFCLEDRALLCRKCDFGLHKVNSLVSLHQRFLLTGVRVGLEVTESGPSTSSWKTQSNEKISEPEYSLPNKTIPVSSSGQNSESLLVQTSVGEESSKMPLPWDSATGSISPWQLDESLWLGEFNQNYDFIDNGSSKVNQLATSLEDKNCLFEADSGKLGDSDCSPTIRAADGELEGDECMGHVADTFWAVPQISSPPTASGLYCPKNNQDPSNSSVFVPDISSSPMQNSSDHHQSHTTILKQRRHF